MADLQMEPEESGYRVPWSAAPTLLAHERLSLAPSVQAA
mgnify:CR=1 FL=1